MCLVKHAFRLKFSGLCSQLFRVSSTPTPGPAAAAAGRILLEQYRAVDIGRGRADRQERLGIPHARGGRGCAGLHRRQRSLQAQPRRYVRPGAPGDLQRHRGPRRLRVRVPSGAPGAELEVSRPARPKRPPALLRLLRGLGWAALQPQAIPEIMRGNHVKLVAVFLQQALDVLLHAAYNIAGQGDLHEL